MGCLIFFAKTAILLALGVIRLFKNKKRLLILFCLAIVSTLVFISAGGYFRGEEESNQENDGAAKNLPLTKEVEVFLFFADPVLIGTGELGEFGYVMPIARTLTVEEGEDIITRALEALSAGPQVEDGDYYATIPATAEMIAVTKDGSTLTINFSQNVLADSPGGTLWGSTFVQSIVFTATQFPEVRQVMVLVEGELWDDGHSVWEKPLGQEDLRNF